VSRPAPTVRQTPKPASRPQPKPSRRSEPKSAPKPSRRSTPKPSRVDRSTDRAFSGGSRGKPRRGLDYYPTGTRVETSVSGRCAKEESLGLFIPTARKFRSSFRQTILRVSAKPAPVWCRLNLEIQRHMAGGGKTGIEFAKIGATVQRALFFETAPLPRGLSLRFTLKPRQSAGCRGFLFCRA
jgi:hypothetical protein